MKKLFALMLSLCLLCSMAIAEGNEEPVVLDWADYATEEILNSGYEQQITVCGITMLYWIPKNMAAFDVSQIETDVPPAAVYTTADQNYSISVFALTIPSLEDYAAGLEAKGVSNFRNITLNGFDVIGAEDENNSIDILIVPMDDTTVLVFNFTPLNGDDEWDGAKVAVVASVRIAE